MVRRDGTFTDLAVDPTRPDTVWVAAASGGVWRSDDAGALNSNEALIANFGSSRECETAHWIKVTVEPHGAYTVLNSRNGFSQSYRSK